MHSVRKNLAIFALAVASLGIACAGISWWSGAGPVADALRTLAGGGEPAFIKPEDVPACGPAWRVVESPNPSDEYSELRAVAALSPRSAWAAGTKGTEEYALTLVERWDGARWSEVPSPSVSNYSNHLHAVSASSEGNAWAVGGSHRGSEFWQTLALRWDGAMWRVVPTLNLSPITILNGVAALSPSDVWAVGEYSQGRQGQGPRTLILHWDGNNWKVVPSPDGGTEGALNAVAARSADDVWAVGSQSSAPGAVPQPLALHWDGEKWTALPVPGAGELWAVSSASPQDVWAVGNSGPRTLTMRWDGAQWSPVESPNPGDGANSLTSVAALSPNNVWAAGSQNVGGIDRPLALHWDGTAWKASPAPYVGEHLSALAGVAAATPDDIWAVGSYIADSLGTSLTMALRYSDPCAE